MHWLRPAIRSFVKAAAVLGCCIEVVVIIITFIIPVIFIVPILVRNKPVLIDKEGVRSVVKAQLVMVEINACGWIRFGEEKMLIFIIKELVFREISRERGDLKIVSRRNRVVGIIEILEH